MKKAEKSIFVDNLTEDLKTAKSIILVNFSGLTVIAQQELKKRLKESGSRLVVVKNSLLKRAGEKAKVEPQILTDTVLSGQTALVISDADPISPLQVLGKFSKEHETPKFKVGVVEGSFQDSDQLLKLSSLPGRDALLGQLLGVLMGSEYGLVGTLNANLQKLVYVLDQKAKTN